LAYEFVEILIDDEACAPGSMSHYDSTAPIENKTSMKHIQVIASRYEQDDISIVHNAIGRDQFF
jgi:hypothetical protein